MAISDHLIKTTVRIESKAASGAVAHGTGFLFFFAEAEGLFVPAIITNRHVVEHYTTTVFHLQTGDDDRVEQIQINGSDEAWIFHPAGLDLAMLPISTVIQGLYDAGKKANVTPFRYSDVADSAYCEGLTVIEDIVMIGYPTGLWDAVHNRPISRRGITATSVNVDFNGHKLFVIDCACWPGSSGSPVIHYQRGVVIEQNSAHLGEHFKLLGILSSGPVFKANGEITEMSAPATLGSVARTDLMINLGYCIPARELKAFEDLAWAKRKSGELPIAGD